MSEAEKHSVKPVVFYDGDCAFCNYSVQALLSIDDDEILCFAPLQGDTARAFLPPELRKVDSLSTIAFRDASGKITTKSTAIIEILIHIGAPYNLAILAKALPTFLRDHLYELVARNRKRILSSQTCEVPNPNDYPRFLP